MSRAVLKKDRRKTRVRTQCHEEGCIFYASDNAMYCYLHREEKEPSFAEVVAGYIANGRKACLANG
jgi:hypothetical protein